MTWGNPESFSEQAVSSLLKPASALYWLASSARSAAYEKGYIKRRLLPVPVISVGNLTVGGTGKTPLTIDLAKRLIGGGHKVSIVSRGYRRHSGEDLLVVSDGLGGIVGPTEAGDEPYMMAHAVAGATVIVSAKRALAAEIAVKVYGASVILLDDGFQHLAIGRDLDLVLLDYNDDLLKDSLLPAGRLREPVSALKRADWIVISKVPEAGSRGRLSRLEEIIRQRAPQSKITSCRFRPKSFRRLDSSNAAGVDTLSGVKAIAFCGIARPETFFNLLIGLGVNLAGKRAFSDHCWFKSSDMELLRSELLESGADLILTTEKDAARLDRRLCGGLPIGVIELETEWLGAIPSLPAPATISRNGGGQA